MPSMLVLKADAVPFRSILSVQTLLGGMPASLRLSG